MIGLKVIMGDPSNATGSDAFAWVGASFSLDDYKIRFKMAKQFFTADMQTIARYASRVHKIIKPNFMAIETNNRGKDILDLFHRKYHMKWLKGVATSANMTDKARAKGFTMDKPFMVQWFQEQMKDHNILFPDAPRKDMQEFIDQVPKIVETKTLTGLTSYKAHRGQHDDLFMAGLHCCNFIRLFIEQQEQLK